MKPYIDVRPEVSTKYELFAINLRKELNNKDGHEICIVKRNGIWYEINDTKVRKIYYDDYKLKNIDGLFYKKVDS